MKLKDYTEAQLMQELAERKKEFAESEIRAEKAPTPIDKPDWSRVFVCATESLQQSVIDKYEDEDIKGWIYEAVMTTIYGEGYWPWRNQQTW